MSSLTSIFSRLTPRRVHAISAVLLPYTPAGAIDWTAFAQHLQRTRSAGLDVAVNMDTGFGDLLSEGERCAVLDTTARLCNGAAFFAGAFADGSGNYGAAIDDIVARGGTPVIVQSRAMHGLAPAEKAAMYHRACRRVERALAFELAPVFAPHGEIWDEDSFRRIMDIASIVGAKHSSLDRATELRRLALRDRHRPDFRIYTGNDLAIDMVAYGSDYLLGLSTFAPEAFAARDRALAADDVRFLALNDALQHLGNVGFRAPVPAYKHSAALYLQLTGGLQSDCIHPRAPRRPNSDRILLADCAARLEALVPKPA